ncbi:acyltransferase family protein [Salana multivorans]
MNGEAAPAHRTYRHDIDGLRAVAIALVAAYHVWGHGRVSGGVDVFLMVSGFFVGGALLRRVSAGTGPRLRAYLPRLARRLLPALVITLAGVVIGTYFLLPRTEWTDVSAGVLASLTYWQNWHLAITGQMYGAADPDISPVQHIWSLSVQGQVFLLMPLLLLAAGRLLRSFRCEERTRSRVLVWLVVLLAAGSFGYACCGCRSHRTPPTTTR